LNSGKTIRKVLIRWGKFEIEAKIVHLAERKPLPSKIKIHKECTEKIERWIKCPHCKAELKEVEKTDFCPECEYKIIKKEKINYCPHCKREIPKKEILEVYRLGKKFVPAGTEQKKLQKLYPRKNQLVIEKFIPFKSVNPVYFDKSYLLLPEQKSSYGYFVLKKGLEETETAALGDVLISKNYYRAIIRADGSFLLLTLLFYQDEINFPSLEKIAVDTSLVELMEEGIRKSTYRFKPEQDCKNRYKETLEELLEKKTPLIIDIQKPLKEEIKSITKAIQENIEKILKGELLKKSC